MRAKRTIFLLSMVLLGLTAILPAHLPAAAHHPGDLLAPINPEFLKYMDKTRPAQAGHSTIQGELLHQHPPLSAIIPPTVNLSHVKGTIDPKVDQQDYPARYDLRNLGRVPPVKHQEGFMTCWTFAAMGSIESNLLPGEVTDFSEWHLANTHGFDYTVAGAGNSFMTTAYMIRWSGPVHEEDEPYGLSENVDPNTPPAKHVQEVLFLPEREDSLDNNTIKYFVINHGAVDFAYNYQSYGFDPVTNSMYVPMNSGQNHRLTIVGWDDDYSASNFAYTPGGNGAFIIRNSWGIGWGESGYFYLSYYDRAIDKLTCFLNAEPITNYNGIYQHDPLGQTQTWGLNESWGANIFTAADNQPLAAAGFYTTDAGTHYEAYVYKQVNRDGGSPVTGTLVARQSGSFTYPGYHTVPLDTDVPLSRGETFSVAVKFSNPQYPHSVPLETCIPGHSSGAASTPGQSFISENGTEWLQADHASPGCNVCIKGYSRYTPPPISIRAERKTISAWIVTAQYAYITVTLEGLGSAGNIDKLVLYRDNGDRNFTPLAEISPAQLENNTWLYEDKHLGRYIRYRYYVEAFNQQGGFRGNSNKVAI